MKAVVHMVLLSRRFSPPDPTISLASLLSQCGLASLVLLDPPSVLTPSHKAGQSLPLEPCSQLMVKQCQEAFSVVLTWRGAISHGISEEAMQAAQQFAKQRLD